MRKYYFVYFVLSSVSAKFKKSDSSAAVQKKCVIELGNWSKKWTTYFPSMDLNHGR